MDLKSKSLYTDSGEEIPWFGRDSSVFVDRTTLIFGGSMTGKTTIMEEILYKCKDYIPNYIVIAPRTSDSAYRSKLPEKCIKEDLSKELLSGIWERQVSITQVYNIANDKNNLGSLFMKINNTEYINMINNIIMLKNKKIDEINKDDNITIGERKSQTVNIEDLTNKKVIAIYKKIIRGSRTYLSKMKLTDMEAITLQYLDLNPRLMLIMDDITEKFKSWTKMYKTGEDNVLENIFYRGRHNFITLVAAAHDDKMIPTELRKNARVTYYTSSKALIASMTKQQSGFSKDEKKLLQDISGVVFSNKSGKKEYKKLCYLQGEEQPFKYLIADVYPEFKLGSKVFRNLADKMPKSENKLSDNPFITSLLDKKVKKSKKKPNIKNRIKKFR